MAGIGFELRKIFGKESILSKIKGAAFAAMATIGPTVTFILLLLAIRIFLNAMDVRELEQHFFSSACLYLFVLATIVSSVLNTISSRYTADRIFEGEEKFIPSTMYGTVFLAVLASALFTFVICAILYVKYQVSLWFLAGYYLFGIMIAVTYTVMTFISAIKEYMKITKSYLAGMLVTCIVCGILHLLKQHPILCILYGMAVGFFTINILLIYYVLSYFKESNRRFFAFTGYYRKYPYLFLSGVFYILGLYITNIIYWFLSDIAEVITVFHIAPAYDMATFMAIIVNLPATVIFVVKVETEVFTRYKKYVSAVNYAGYDVIDKYREMMCNTISVQLFFVYEVQLIITVILTCLSVFLFPMIGLGGLILDFFLLLGMGYYCIFSMYFTIVMLYYFDDSKGAFASAGIFLAVTVIAAFAAVKLGIGYYAIPPLAGSLVGWATAFLRLRSVLGNINARLFCRQ